MSDQLLKEAMMQEVLLEIGTVSDYNKQIELISKLMSRNLVAIYDAVTEIDLSKSETFKAVRKLVAKQDCYEQLRKQLATDHTVKPIINSMR